MSASGHVSCTDFGLSKEDMTDEDRTKSFVGTMEYLAPELIKKRGYGKAVDWWALGILTFEMIQGDSPFRHKVPTMLFEKIMTEDPKFTDRFNSEAKDLITKLLNKNPAKRLGCGPHGAEEIKSHPFFSDIDFDAVYNKTAEMPPAPHRPEEVTSIASITKAVVKTRETREEIMPDSPIAVLVSPTSQKKKHFDRFTFVG